MNNTNHLKLKRASLEMMIKSSIGNIAKVLGLLYLCMAPLAHADTKLEDFALMAMGPLDGRAVVKSADGRMHVLKVGDTLPGTQAKVLQVLADKLVVEDSVGKEDQTKIRQTVWLNKSAHPGVPGPVQRFDTQGPAPAQHEVTILKAVGQDKASTKGAQASAKLQEKAKQPDDTKNKHNAKVPTKEQADKAKAAKAKTATDKAAVKPEATIK